MKIFVAGATGAIGRRLVPSLVADGHHVVGMTHSPARLDLVQELGAEPVLADGLNAKEVRTAVLRSRPDVVVHQMTALSNMRDLKHLDDEFAWTNKLRTEGTEYLLQAAVESGAKRFVAQSFTGWRYSRAGGRVKTEEDPLDPNPPKEMSRTVESIGRLEELVTGTDRIPGVALRYGMFYGPGTSIGDGGDMTTMVRQRKLPVFGDGAGVWSFLHIDDAAAATRIAIERGPSGIYNIVDDEPAEVATWLPDFARAIGAKPPLHLPAWLGRLVIGEAGLAMMTQVSGSSNAKAKRVLGWQPKYASWREGFRRALADTPSAIAS